MIKKVGIIKRVFMLLLIFLLSINSFAAIVSDNDGSAFITKAEFDALKNTFQSQIDSYNQSIDSKIDGAIASYLAGITIATGESREVLSLANLPDGENITSQENTSFQYVYSRAKWYVDVFWGANINSKGAGYSSVGKAGVNISPGNKAMKRPLVEKVDNIYKWLGYASYDVNEKILHTVCINPGKDTGFMNTSPYYVRMPVFKNISESGDNYPAGELQGHVTAHIANNADGDATWDTSSATLSINQNYTLSNKFDFIFANNETTSVTQVWFDPSVAGTFLCLAPYDRVKDYWSSAWNAGTIDSNVRTVYITIHTDARNASINRANGKSTIKMLDDAPTTLTQWKDIYANDSNKYTYDGPSGKQTISNYPITAGIPIVSLKTDEEFTWNMAFTDATPKDVYFFYYNRDIDVPTEDQCIKVSVNGASPQAINTVGKNAKITYRAEKNGIIFAKWRYQGSNGGGTLSTADSKIINITKPN